MMISLMKLEDNWARRKTPIIRGRSESLKRTAIHVTGKRKRLERKLKALGPALREKSSNHSSAQVSTPRTARVIVDLMIALERSSARQGNDLT